MKSEKLARLRRLLIIGAVVFATLAGAELAVRWIPQLQPAQLQIRSQTILSKDRILPDSEIGFVRAPGGKELVKTLDFSFWRETDAKGFPNRRAWPKQADIVLLGDSLVMGEGVGIDKSFASLVAQDLPGTRLVNLGVAGAAPDRQYRVYRRFGEALKPRLVVAVLFVAADLTNAIHFSSWRREAPQEDYNRYRLNYAKQKDTRAYLSAARLIGRSRLVAVIRSEWNKWRNGERSEGIVRLNDGSVVYLSLPTLEFLKTIEPDRHPALSLMLDPLRELQRDVNRAGGHLLVVLMPSKEEVFGATDSPRVLSLEKASAQRLSSWGISCLDLTPVLGSAAERRSPYFKTDIHLNEYGNRIVANQLLAWVKTDIGTANR